MGKELPSTCYLCNRALRYAHDNKKAASRGLPVGSNTHDPDAKSEAHFGHIGGARSRSEFAKLSDDAWSQMGVRDPRGSVILCYECHEVVLHNPVLNEAQMEQLGSLFRGKQFVDKVVILNRLIGEGLARLSQRNDDRASHS